MSGEKPQIYEFGRFHLDAAKRLLLCAGEPVPLTPKAFETLLALVEHHGQVVEKDELMRRIWPDSFVEEGNLSVNVFALRKALGEARGDHHYIVTVPGRGYRFVADVREAWDEETQLIVEEHTSSSITIEQEEEVANYEVDGKTNLEAIRSVGLGSVHPVSTAGYLPANVKHHRREARGTILVLVGFPVAVGLALALYYFISKPATPFQSMTLTRIAQTGNATYAAISPDGKYVAYVRVDAGLQSLWVRQVNISNNLQIVSPAEVEYWGLTFSPDSTNVYYIVKEKNSTIGVLNQVSMLGGSSRRLIVDVDSPVTFSPDGERLAFLRRSPILREDALMLANADGTNEQKLASYRFPDFLSKSRRRPPHSCGG